MGRCTCVSRSHPSLTSEFNEVLTSQKNPNTKIPNELEQMQMLIPRPADLVYEPR